MVPVFSVEGQNMVVVDCYDNKSSEWDRIFLPATEHPSEFETMTTFDDKENFKIQVSLLEAENTLVITTTNEQSEPLIVETYGTECGLTSSQRNIYCAVFTGELPEN